MLDEGPMGSRALWSYQLNLTAQPISASNARDFVCFHLRTRRLSHLSDDVELVVSELATNAIVHAQTPFKVSIQAFQRTLLLAVEDGSPTGPRRVTAHVLDTGGRGMAIVNLLSHAWGVDTGTHGGKSVWAEFELRGQD